MAHEAGKGSRPRPYSVTQDEYDRRWDAIFCRDLDDKNEDGEVIRGAAIFEKEEKRKNEIND